MVTTAWDRQPKLWTTLSFFSQELCKTFDHAAQESEVAKHLLSIYQRTRSVAEYSVVFRILVAKLGWNDAALQVRFLKWVNDELALGDEVDLFDLLVSVG